MVQLHDLGADVRLQGAIIVRQVGEAVLLPGTPATPAPAPASCSRCRKSTHGTRTDSLTRLRRPSAAWAFLPLARSPSTFPDALHQRGNPAPRRHPDALSGHLPSGTTARRFSATPGPPRCPGPAAPARARRQGGTLRPRGRDPSPLRHAAPAPHLRAARDNMVGSARGPHLGDRVAAPTARRTHTRTPGRAARTPPTSTGPAPGARRSHPLPRRGARGPGVCSPEPARARIPGEARTRV